MQDDLNSAAHSFPFIYLKSKSINIYIHIICIRERMHRELCIHTHSNIHI
jgi:hypothetical protein